jgi:hypothetical protein
MKRQWLLKGLALGGLLGVASLTLSAQPALPGSSSATSALPGTVNYLEGQVSINGTAIATGEIGKAHVAPDQTLATGSGKAEVLLAPGTFLRVGDNSEIRMDSLGIVNPRVELVSGEAMVEVDQKAKDSQIDILQGQDDSSILKPGLYNFDSRRGKIEVLDGKLQVTENGREKTLGKGKEALLNDASLKTVSFDPKAEDDLYRWSSVRSDYLAEANASTARSIYMGYDPYAGPGWYWNPWFTAWSWLPGDGFFYSPFGYPFFSPAYVVYAPYGYGRFGYAGHGGLPARAGFAARGGVALAPRAGGLAGGGAHFAGGGAHFAGGGGAHFGGGGGRR